MFEDSFQVLGVLVQIKKDHVIVGNTESRLQQLRDEAQAILEKGSWIASLASKLAGRLNFAKAWVSGRPLNFALWAIHARAARNTGQEDLSSDDVKALE